MAPSFLPWHRRFLLEFECALREVDPKVTVPYWDWTADNTPAASLWADDFLGGNGRPGDRQVMTGPFAYAAGNWTIRRRRHGGQRSSTRDFGRPARPIALPTKAELARAMNEKTYDAAPWDSTAASGFRNALEGWTTGKGSEALAQPQPRPPLGRGRHAGRRLPQRPGLLAPPRLRRPALGPLAAEASEGDLPAAEEAAGDDPQRGRALSLEEPMPPWDVRPSALLGHQDLYRYDA